MHEARKYVVETNITLGRLIQTRKTKNLTHIYVSKIRSFEKVAF